MSTKQERNLIYTSRRWRKLRQQAFDRTAGLCAECERQGYTTEAKIAHHITPWKTGKTRAERHMLIWDIDNIEPVCESCHSALHYEMIEINKESNEISNLAYELLGIKKDINEID